MPGNEVWLIQSRLETAWKNVRTAITRMHPSSEIRPLGATDVFQPDRSVASRFNVSPIVFHVPERANTSQANLYVVLSGWISFAVPQSSDPRQTTMGFSTEVGYFRDHGEGLSHVYGVHYDMDEHLPGHPVFHAQLTSQEAMVGAIEAQCHRSFDSFEDHAKGLLRNVRTPTAQMDVFSVITQIGADHLMSEKSIPEVRRAFSDLRKACDFFVGAAGRLAYLNSPLASQCYRSTHWYERPEVA